MLQNLKSSENLVSCLFLEFYDGRYFKIELFIYKFRAVGMYGIYSNLIRNSGKLVLSAYQAYFRHHYHLGGGDSVPLAAF